MTNIEMRTEDDIGWLILNRPLAANTINMPLARELLAAVQQLRDDAKVGCLVLTGTGRQFCGGGDLADFGTDDPGSMPDRVRALADCLHASVEVIEALDKPFVTAIQGTAAGAGVVLGALGDIALASDKAKFVPAYEQIGLTPDGGSTFYLPRLMGERAAMEFLLTGRVLSAREAAQVNLITREVPHEELMEEVKSLARMLVSGGGWRAGRARRLVRRSRMATLHDQLDAEAASIAEAIGRPDSLAAINAFLQRG